MATPFWKRSLSGFLKVVWYCHCSSYRQNSVASQTLFLVDRMELTEWTDKPAVTYIDGYINGRIHNAQTLPTAFSIYILKPW